MAINQLDFSPESLIKATKKAQLKEALKKLEIQFEKLKVRSEIEGIDFSEDLGKMEKEISNLKDEGVNYESYEHPILTLKQNYANIEERLRKLNEKKGKIQESVYNSLKNEYLSEKEALTRQLDQTKTQLKKIQKEASKGTQSLKYGIEELSIRKDIEEIPDDVFEERLANLNSQIAQSEELMTAVTFLLNLVEN